MTSLATCRLRVKKHHNFCPALKITIAWRNQSPALPVEALKRPASRGYTETSDVVLSVRQEGDGRGVWHVWGTWEVHTGFLVVETVWNRPLGRPWCTWEDNIITDLHETGWGKEDWIARATDSDMWLALVNALLNLRVLQMRGISWVAEELLASQERLCTT